MDDFARHTGIDWNGMVGVVQYGSDTSMVCMFYNKSVHNPAKSLEEGHPIYEDRVYVRIHPPGERLNIVDKPADDTHKRRWPIQWAQFQQNRQQLPEGTPIDLLYPDHPSIGAQLRAGGVYTVEQCEALSGSAIDNIGMGAQRWVNDAKKYLEAAKKGMATTQVRAELEERDREIRVQQQQIEKLKAQVESLITERTQAVDINSLQAMLSGIMARPTYPPAAMGVAGRAVGDGLAPAFDAATAQINATRAATVPQRRQRTRIK